MYKRIVIKIGTSLLADKVRGINLDRVQKIAAAVAALCAAGKEVCLVTSGAIGAGVAALKLKERPVSIPEKQATAAIGQPLLMEAYEHAFRKQNILIGQLLLTKDDFVDRQRYLNAKNTFAVLLKKGVVPIINENDTVAVEEIKVGDNDNISAMVANLIEADILLILSNIKGLCKGDPSQDTSAELVPVVEKITPEIEKLVKNSKGELATGGMATKIQAAKKCAAAGITMVIADGTEPAIINEIMAGEPRGTLFVPCDRKLTQRQLWIAYIAHAKGRLSLDAGALEALLKKGKSLLPSGLKAVSGKFNAGDVVVLTDKAGSEIAKGVVEYSSLDAEKIKGKKSSELLRTLGFKGRTELVHRDNLVILK